VSSVDIDQAESFSELFRSNAIDGSVLHNCHADDLREILKALGMSASDRRFMLMLVREWRDRPVCRDVLRF
jgi:hypothetical protein